MFWFNPFVWILAREAHQLREEAADDSVLAADIADTDYAQLLVGVARHECPGLLLGAHGVAPSKSSLARRVARVLDGKIGARPGRPLVRRRRVCRRDRGRCAARGADVDARPRPRTSSRVCELRAAHRSPPASHIMPDFEVPTDLPHIIAQGVSTRRALRPRSRRDQAEEAVRVP